MKMPSNPPIQFAVLLFPKFQLLDACGPLDILNVLSTLHPIRISLLSHSLDPVYTGANSGPALQPTHTFSAPPDSIDVLLVPGGIGGRDLSNTAMLEKFLRDSFPKDARHLFTVCTGSAVVARTGLLNGKRCTTNKKSWEWATSQGPTVNWVPKARWVQDGQIWTSSGVAAGIDAMYAFLAAHYGEELAQYIADSSEYLRIKDAENDRFAERWNVPGS